MSTKEEFFSEITDNINCFLCNKHFQIDNEEVLLLFEKRSTENGVGNCSFAEILSSILGRSLNENNTHSKLICQTCAQVIHDYELIEQHYFDLKQKIIEDFNRTAKANNVPGIDIDDIILNEDDEEENEVYKIVMEHDNSSDCATYDHQDSNENHLNTNENENRIELMVENNSIKTVDEVFTTEQLLTMLNDSEQSLSNEIDKTLNINENVNKVNQEDHQVEEIFIQNDENMIEVVTDDDIHYEQIIEKNSNIDETADGKMKKVQNINSVKGSPSSLSSISNHSKRKRQQMKNGKFIAPSKPVYLINGDKITCLLCNPSNEKQGEAEEEEEEEEQTNDLKMKTFEFDFRTISIHLRTVHLIRIYICDICGKEFNKRSEMNDHVDEEHGGTEDGEYSCEICNRIFKNLRLFRVHKRLHSSLIKQFSCTHCEKKFTSKNLLNEHINMHTGQRPYKCNHCPKDFASKYTFTAHLKIHQNRPRPFGCSQCSKSFFSAQNLQQHEKIHSGVKEFICEVCKKAFGTQHNLDVHKVVHTGHKPYICRVCSKAFARRAEIRDHERVHTGEKPFTCDLCNMSFAQRSNLTTHKRATHLNDKRYKCEECDRSFKRRRLLDYHIRSTHTGERPYKCDLCGASFVYPEHFKKHQRIHSGEKPYACEVCGKTFNSRDNRNAHRFVHSDKKPYECLVCGHGFMRKPLLYSHMQQAGHMNDTIIVNQPRITKEGEIKINENLIKQQQKQQPQNEQNETTEIIVEEDVNSIVTMKNDNNYDDNDKTIPIKILTDSTNISEFITPDEILLQDNDQIMKTEDGLMQIVRIAKYDSGNDMKNGLQWVNFIDSKSN